MSETVTTLDPIPDPGPSPDPTSGADVRPAGCGCGCGAPDPARLDPARSDPGIPSEVGLVPWVYAIGRVEARIPTLSVEKELAQVTSTVDTDHLSDQQVLRRLLAAPENRYLLRHLCWVLVVQEIDTYLLVPRYPSDLDLLLEAVREHPGTHDLDVVIGRLGPLAGPETCNGLVVPMVAVDQLYPFDRAAFAEAVPREDDTGDDEHADTVHHVLQTVLQMADNAGVEDENRALNYLAMRYAEIYRTTARQLARGSGLSGIDVEPARLRGDRRVVDCRLRYTDRRTTYTETYAVSVDVTEEFPFLVGRLSPYYDRTIRS